MAKNKTNEGNFGEIHFISKFASDEGDLKKYLAHLFSSDAENKIAVVAYVGKNPISLLKGISLKGLKVVCDATSLGTNPDGVRQLQARQVKVFNYPRLHSKVYFSSKGALVGSGNFSWNGFGDSETNLEEVFVWVSPGSTLYGEVSKYCNDSLLGKREVDEDDLRELTEDRELHNLDLPKITRSWVHERNSAYLCLWFGRMTLSKEDVNSELSKFSHIKMKDYFEESSQGGKSLFESNVWSSVIIPYEADDKNINKGYAGPQLIRKRVQKKRKDADLFVTMKLAPDEELNKEAKLLLLKLRDDCMKTAKVCHAPDEIESLLKKKYGESAVFVTKFGKGEAKTVSSVFVEYNSILNHVRSEKARR